MEYPQSPEIKINNLSVEFKTRSGSVPAVRHASLEIPRNRITALVGESGSGKSVTSLAVMDLLPSNGKITDGTIFLDGTEITSFSHKKRAALNGSSMGMIFQSPSDSLDPLYTVGSQITDAIKSHGGVTRREAHRRAVQCLNAMGLPQPERIMDMYTFELSGGMCQRVMIALAMAQKPNYLFADEPTTALDVTVQYQILTEIYRLNREQNIGVLFITHDLRVVAEIADWVYIMHDGEIVESGDVGHIFRSPSHPYTQKLLKALI